MSIEDRVRQVLGASGQDNGPELTKLLSRLSSSRGFSVSWGPDAHLLTVEARAQTLNESFERMEAGDLEAIDMDSFDSPKTDVNELVKKLSSAGEMVDTLD